MEIWFLSTLAATILAGVSNFYFKHAAARGYDAQLFSLYGAALSTTIASVAMIFFPSELFGYGLIAYIIFFGGLLASVTNILKVYALRYIDSTIYFPLFKIVAPSIAIVAGVILFNESFTQMQWIGMTIGLSVPLLLITKAENTRQNNLLAGLVIVLVTSITSAGTIIANKYGVDLQVPILVVLLYASIGIFAGTVISMIYKNGVTKLSKAIREQTSSGLIRASFSRAALISASFWLMLYAFANGGTLAIVQTINSMYILIPIVLAIIFYNEHWNAQKVIAIVLSVLSLALLG